MLGGGGELKRKILNIDRMEDDIQNKPEQGCVSRRNEDKRILNINSRKKEADKVLERKLESMKEICSSRDLQVVDEQEEQSR
jgi:hypothetical protein